MQILLDCSFREVQLVSDFLVQFGSRDQADNLLLSKAEFRVKRLVPSFWTPAGGANPLTALTGEFPAAAETASQVRKGRFQFENVHNPLQRIAVGDLRRSSTAKLVGHAVIRIQGSIAGRFPFLRQWKRIR
jgi:hypothetical protein